MSEHLSSELNFRYVLLGRIQTDDLEARVGQYSQMCGSNYHISVAQVFESERKLKLLGLLNLKSGQNGNFHLKEFLDMCEEETSQDAEDKSIDLFEEAIGCTENYSIAQNEIGVLIYIAGYIIHKIKKSLKCAKCISLCCVGRNLELDNNHCEQYVFEYLKHLDRGGLKWPRELLVNIVSQMYALFQALSLKVCF